MKKRIKKKRIVIVVVAILVVLAALVGFDYQSDLRASYERVEGKSSNISSPYGNIEYTESGEGPDVLVIHGGGGGYDQGEQIAQAVLNDQFRCITPSRFGYLKSSLPESATYEDQAHAYAYLLDYLKIEKVAVVAMSAGGPSALNFAILYPERISSLTLISAGVTNVSSEEGKQGDKQGKMISAIMQRDFSYWATTTLFMNQFVKLMGANEEVISTLSQEQIESVEEVIEYMNPASLRKKGAAFDHVAELPNHRISGIQTPTLIIHAKDDTLQPYQNAVFANSTIPGSRLVGFEEGGHLVMIIKESIVSKEVQKHILNPVFEKK